MGAPSPRQLLIGLAVFIVLMIAGAFALSRWESSDEGGKLPKTKGSDRPSVSRTDDGTDPVTTTNFKLTPVSGYDYSKRTEGGYTQITVRRSGSSTVVGLIIVGASSAADLAELVSIQSGGDTPYDNVAPRLKNLKIGKRPARLLISSDELESRVTGIALHKGKSVLIYFSGAVASTDELEKSVRDHAAAITLT